MRKHEIVRDIILLALGACLYGFIGAAAEACGSRSAGNFGGEVLVIPLFIGLVWLGWELRGQHK